MSKSFVLVILAIFLIGFIVSAIFRLYIHFKEIKELEKYNLEMSDRMNRLNKQMAYQTANFAETLEIIHNDYNRMIHKMKYDNYEKGGALKVEMDKMVESSDTNRGEGTQSEQSAN